MSPTDPVAILCAELRRVHGVHLTRVELGAMLREAGLTLVEVVRFEDATVLDQVSGEAGA